MTATIEKPPTRDMRPDGLRLDSPAYEQAGGYQAIRFTLLPIVCLGYCDHAPAMMVDADLHSDLDPQKIDTQLEKYK
jgi:hypothetical protein